MGDPVCTYVRPCQFSFDSSSGRKYAALHDLDSSSWSKSVTYLFSHRQRETERQHQKRSFWCLDCGLSLLLLLPEKFSFTKNKMYFVSLRVSQRIRETNKKSLLVQSVSISFGDIGHLCNPIQPIQSKLISMKCMKFCSTSNIEFVPRHLRIAS